MKTETKIAEEYLEERARASSKGKTSQEYVVWFQNCLTHKASCQRFLEFFEDFKGYEGEVKLARIIHNKIFDLRNAIKKYDEAGI